MTLVAQLVLAALVAGTDPAAPPPTPPEPPPRESEATQALLHLLFPSFFSGNLSLGAGLAAGSASGSTAMADLTKPQFVFGLEGGVRPLPALTLAGYVEIGSGSTGKPTDQACHAAGFHCQAASYHVGGLLRYAFTPQAPTTTWVALGSGWESTEVASNNAAVDTKVVTFTGWEWLRLSAGYDFRFNGVLGLGFFAQASVGRFGTVEDASGKQHLSSAPVHGWFLLATRFMYGP
jgi:hypothetical protein